MNTYNNSFNEEKEQKANRKWFSHEPTIKEYPKDQKSDRPSESTKEKLMRKKQSCQEHFWAIKKAALSKHTLSNY